MKVLVYGTLKEGFSSEYLLGLNRKKIKNVRLSGFKMYNSGWYPCVVKGDNEDEIVGELWDIDSTCVNDLDMYEGHPNLFKRVSLDTLDGTQMYLYQNSVEGMQRISSGVFE